MNKNPLILIFLLLFPFILIKADPQPTEKEQKNLSLKEKYQIAKIVFSNGTAGITDVIKDKLQQSALMAKDAITSSVEQTQLAVERAKTEFAQQQEDLAKKEIESLKKEVEELKTQLEVAKKMLINAQESKLKR